jgi:phosphoglycolate phosphatase
MIPAFPVYVFDVDGTLLDSQLDICGAIQDVLAARGRTDITHERLRTYIGRHLYDEFLELGFTQSDLEQMIQEYRTTYAQRKHANTQIYAGIAETLARMGGRKTTATTKGTASTKLMLEQFELISHFDHVQGTDGFPAKPEPDVLLKCIDAMGVRKEDCLFIGDAPTDIEAGHRAGIRTCAVTWGYGDRQQLADAKPDFWAHAPHELLADY